MKWQHVLGFVVFVQVTWRKTLNWNRLSVTGFSWIWHHHQPGFWALITEQIEVGGAVSWACSFASSKKEAARPAADRAWPDNESTSAPLNTSGTRYRIRSSDFSRSGEVSSSTACTQQHGAKITWLPERLVIIDKTTYNNGERRSLWEECVPGLDRGITLGNCLLQGRSGLRVEITCVIIWKHNHIHGIFVCTLNQLFQVPDDVFTEGEKRLLLVVSEYFKHNGLSLDVVHKGFSHFNSNL